MVLREREKNILAILSVVAVALTYFYWTKPSMENNANTKKHIAKIQRELRSPKVKEEDIEKLHKEIEKVERSIKVLKYQIPKSEQRGFLIRDIETLAGKNEIELLNFLPKEAIAVTLGGQEITEKMKKFLKKRRKSVAGGKVLKTVIEIDSTGTFESYKKFFGDIITYYRAVEVADLNVTRGSAVAKIGADKRFSRKKRGKDAIADLEDTTLNVSFTLYAYTSIED